MLTSWSIFYNCYQCSFGRGDKEIDSMKPGISIINGKTKLGSSTFSGAQCTLLCILRCALEGHRGQNLMQVFPKGEKNHYRLITYNRIWTDERLLRSILDFTVRFGRLTLHHGVLLNNSSMKTIIESINFSSYMWKCWQTDCIQCPTLK